MAEAPHVRDALNPKSGGESTAMGDAARTRRPDESRPRRVTPTRIYAAAHKNNGPNAR